MKNKITIILTVILALSLAASISVLAVLSEKTREPVQEETTAVKVQDPLSAKDTMKYVNENGVELTLTLEETKMAGDRLVSNYVDHKHNKYTFDSKGNLIGTEIFTPIYDVVDDVTVTPEDNISAYEAREIGEKYLEEVMGEDFGNYSYMKTRDTELSYSVTFETKFGEGGFINGPRCSVQVYKNGEIEGHSVGDSELYETFDYSLLDGLTEDEVVGFAMNVADEACKSDGEIIGKKPLSIVLSYVDEKPCILVEIQLEALIDRENGIYGVIGTREHTDVYETQTYNGPGYLDVVVKYPLG